VTHGDLRKSRILGPDPSVAVVRSIAGRGPGGAIVRLSAVVLLSLLGMGSSSAAVAWLTPRPTVPSLAAAAAPVATAKPAKGPAAPPPAVTVAAPQTSIPSTFAVEGKLRLDGRLGHGVLPGRQASETFLLVEVGALAAAAVEARAPVNLAIVIDRSGSMKGQRLTNAVAAARGMLSRLRPDDTISLVAYDDQAELLVAPTTVDRIDRLGFERVLADMRGSGHTCISCGLDLARAQVRRRTGAINRILLLSDGVANRGLTTVPEFRLLGDVARQEQTAVASIGVDLDYDERTLFAVSQASNGHHYFVEDPSGLPAVFEREAANLVGTVADRVDVDVELADGVELLEVVARGHRREGNRVALAFGSFNAGETKSAVLRVRVAPGAGDRAVAEVRMVYRDMTVDREEQAFGALGLTLDPASDRMAALDPHVEARLGRRDTQEALLTANEAFARGDVAGAQRQLDDAREQVRERLRRSAPAPDSPLDEDFNEQLEALGRAKGNFDDAANSAPTPTVAPQMPAGKKAVRDNVAAADPFG
jgi:Ca-activated chloride channel homolog